MYTLRPTCDDVITEWWKDAATVGITGLKSLELPQ
jgi:hypothetical protein